MSMFYLSPHDIERFRKHYLPLRWHSDTPHIAAYLCCMCEDNPTRIPFTEKHFRDWELTEAIMSFLRAELEPTDFERARTNFKRHRVEIMVALNRGTCTPAKQEW